MKKNFLTAVAITVVAFFVATTIAQAADVNFTGQMRTRFEINEKDPSLLDVKFAIEKLKIYSKSFFLTAMQLVGGKYGQ